jgi:uroporphyrinogen decarboxylase
MNKREALLTLLDPNQALPYIPAAFFLHFDPRFHQGQAAVDKHLEYFRYTGMDFVKIQYERTFPHLPEIQRPQDWRKLPLYKRDFYEPQLGVVEGLVKAAGPEALVIMTLYSPFMCAGHTAGLELVTRHIQEDPEAVRQGMQVITDSLLIFVRGCIALGVDGFYTSTQGGETGRFSDPALFDACVKPYDLVLMKEIEQECSFNILHICDYSGVYDDLSRFLDYPGHVVSCPHQLGGQKLEPSTVARLFGRPVMGGLDRHGVLVTGNSHAIQGAVEEVLRSAPPEFILGADCTVPSEIDWDHLQTAIETAHTFAK